ncbi:MAG: PQQ-dependent dehydrogenase, methanol/ethanol family [Parvibaculales bacterium]
MFGFRAYSLGLLVCALAACQAQPESAVTGLAEAQSGEWVLHGYNGGEQRFVTHKAINTQNVRRLGLAFQYDGILNRGRVLRGTQATPLMKDGVLYFTGPWSVAYAIDARTGEEIWVHDPEVSGQHARLGCCDVVNRGMALRGDTLFLATYDGYLEALDRLTGDVKWRVDTFIDRGKSYTITGAPRLAGNLVLIGNGGGEMGVRGYVTAYDQATGKQVWRFWSVPSAGPDENEDVALARKSWSENTRWEFGGGGTVWDSMVYDSDLGLVYIGVGNGSPWPAWVRNGGDRPDNLYLSSIVAVDAKTGKRVWHYQTTPADSWDYTATQHMILADLEFDGRMRKVIMQAPKNGFFYVLDRQTGELLSAEPFVPVNWASHVDLQSGRPVLTGDADFQGRDALVLPSVTGAHNWHPMSFSPDTGLVYFPTLELTTVLREDLDPAPFMVQSRNQKTTVLQPDPSKHAELLAKAPKPALQSLLKAWNPATGAAAWQSDPMPYWGGGVLSSAGNLVFQGSPDGYFSAYNASTGALLKRIYTGLGIAAPPISYMLDGEQYIAVLAGMGGGMARAYMPGFATEKYVNESRLLVFKLDGGDVPLPQERIDVPQEPVPTGLPNSPELVVHGAKLYEQFCMACHIPRGYDSAYPDLWNLSPETDAMFDDIVLGGALVYAGMGNYSDHLTKEDTLAIRAYLAHDRLQAGQSPADDAGMVVPSH